MEDANLAGVNLWGDKISPIVKGALVPIGELQEKQKYCGHCHVIVRVSLGHEEGETIPKLVNLLYMILWNLGAVITCGIKTSRDKSSAWWGCSNFLCNMATILLLGISSGNLGDERSPRTARMIEPLQQWAVTFPQFRMLLFAIFLRLFILSQRLILRIVLFQLEVRFLLRNTRTCISPLTRSQALSVTLLT